jgi:hypothetical protein
MVAPLCGFAGRRCDALKEKNSDHDLSRKPLRQGGGLLILGSSFALTRRHLWVVGM